MRMAVALMLSLAATAATAAAPPDPYEAPASYRPSDVLSKERVSKLELWLTGAASPTVRQRLGERGILLLEQAGRRVEIID